MTEIMRASPLKMLKEDIWYAEGLRFKCTECGQCCTGAPGYVWVSDEEIKTMANYLGLNTAEFGRKFLRYVDGRYALLEKPGSYDCIFLKDKKCELYQVRPTQCRTFPWWVQNLCSPEDWEEAAKYCEGISQNAPLVPFEVIQEQLNQNGVVS